MSVLIFIDDLNCGKIQISILKQSLEKVLSCEISGYILASSITNLSSSFSGVGENWKVSDIVAKRVLFRYYALFEDAPGLIKIFIDGRVLVSGWDESVFATPELWFVQSESGVSMADQALFLVSSEHNERDIKGHHRAWENVLAEGYESAAGYFLEPSRYLPDVMAPTRSKRHDKRLVLACVQFSEQPWLFAGSQHSITWNAYFREAWHDNRFGIKEVVEDETAGFLRPSIQLCCNHELWELPNEEISRLDTLFLRTVMANDAERRDILRSLVFIPPKRLGDNVKKGVQKLERRGSSKATNSLKKSRTKQLSQSDLNELLSKTPNKKILNFPSKNHSFFVRMRSVIRRLIRSPGILVRAIRNPKVYYARLKELLSLKR